MESEEIHVDMKINGKEVKAHNPIKYDFNEDCDILEVSFMIGNKAKLDKVELVFKKNEYVNEKAVDN